MFAVPIRCEIKKVEVDRIDSVCVSISDYHSNIFMFSYRWIKHRSMLEQQLLMNVFIKVLLCATMVDWVRIIVWSKQVYCVVNKQKKRKIRRKQKNQHLRQVFSEVHIKSRSMLSCRCSGSSSEGIRRSFYYKSC